MNAVAYFPQTPCSSSRLVSSQNNRPRNSSPLAPISLPPSSSPGPASPVAEIQARRRGQYKAHTPSSSAMTSTKGKGRFRNGPSKPIPFSLGPVTADAGQAAFLRERFKANCFERSKRARAKGVMRRRTSMTSEASSDGADGDVSMDIGEKEDAELDGFDDELFKRVVANERRRRVHAYALSYELDVGSSFDPALEDPTSWEELLRQSPSRHQRNQDVNDEMLQPEDLEDVPDFDEYDLDEDNGWVDAYIASLPLESLEEAQHSASSSSRQADLDHQEMDVTMG